jgi:hypothetical protein
MDDGGGSLASVELFDAADNAVQELGSLAEPRVSHTATLLADGRVLIAGGYNGEYLRSVEVFDPTTRRFQSAGSLVEGRSGHTACGDRLEDPLGGHTRLDRPERPRIGDVQRSRDETAGQHVPRRMPSPRRQ